MAYPVVLGSKGFDSGWHFWEIQMEDKTEWTMAVTLSRQDRGWAIQLQNGYCVEQGAVPVTLLKHKGTALSGCDPDVGKISFYYLNNKSHICSFTDKLSAMLMCFTIRYDLKLLTICARIDYEQ